MTSADDDSAQPADLVDVRVEDAAGQCRRFAVELHTTASDLARLGAAGGFARDPAVRLYDRLGIWACPAALCSPHRRPRA